jgi:hypothetical protein
VENFKWKSSSPSNHPPANPMKLRIPPRFHGPLCLLGFAALMAIPALAEWIGGLL